MATAYGKIPAHARAAEMITATTEDGQRVEITRYVPHTSSVTHGDGVQWVTWSIVGQRGEVERFSGRRVRKQLVPLVDTVTALCAEMGATDVAHVVYITDDIVRARKQQEAAA